MAYNSAIDNVYNHYLTTYAPKSSVSKYDTHKKSELRGIYNSMLKLNKDAPLYLLNSAQDSREFAVNLKENARALRNTIASIGGQTDESLFKQKSAYSTDEGMVSAEFIGETADEKSIPSFSIEVTALASPQVNLGYALSSNSKVSLPTDTYSFDVNINDLNYEFQFTVREGDTNKDVQERLARLITNADVGIEADVLENGRGSSALRLTSTSSGLKPGRETIFDVSDDKTSKSSGSVDYFGIDYISGQPSNAQFLLNGVEKSTSANQFTIDKQFELTLNGVHEYEGQTAEIGIKADLESVTENVSSLIDGYNTFIKGASVYHENHPTSTKLLGEMERLVSYYKEGFGKLGISVTNDGSLSLDEKEFKSAMSQDEDFSSLSTIKDFASSVLRKVNQISLNPMEYVDKTIVAYKNPGHNFTAPYVSSNYSGMMFNSYC